MTRKNSWNHDSTASYILLTEKHTSFIWRIYLPCLQMLKNSKSSSKLRLYSFLLPSQKSSWLTPESIFEKLLATLARLLILCLQIEQSVESVVNNIGEDWMEPLSWLLYCLLEPRSHYSSALTIAQTILGHKQSEAAQRRAEPGLREQQLSKHLTNLKGHPPYPVRFCCHVVA